MRYLILVLVFSVSLFAGTITYFDPDPEFFPQGGYEYVSDSWFREYDGSLCDFRLYSGSFGETSYEYIQDDFGLYYFEAPYPEQIYVPDVAFFETDIATSFESFYGSGGSYDDSIASTFSLPGGGSFSPGDYFLFGSPIPVDIPDVMIIPDVVYDFVFSLSLILAFIIGSLLCFRLFRYCYFSLKGIKRVL